MLKGNWAMPCAAAALCAALAGCLSSGGAVGAEGDSRPEEGVEVIQKMNASYSAPELSLEWDGASQIRKVVIEYTYDNPVSATPSGSTRRAYDISLSPEAADALWTELNRLWPAFMALDDAYGAPEGERYYPYSMGITNLGQSKSVLHRDNPSYSGPPEVFSQAVAAMKAAAGE